MQSESSAVIVISSHVIRGSVGNRATVFALETLGFPVWAMPTVVLPWHPGHGRSTRLTFSEDDFENAVEDLLRAPWVGEVKAVMTGYFGNALQVRAVSRLIAALKEKNPALLYLCDPVIGDVGGLYVPQTIAEAIRDDLLPLATIATPNRYELAWLTGRSLDSNTEVMQAAKELGVPRLLVTSAVPMMAGSTGNLYVSGNQAFLAEHREVSNPPHGLGDLLAGVFLARLLSGMNDEQALQLATASVFDVLARAVKRNADELALETDASCLTSPLAMVQMRRLMVPKAAVKR